MQLQVIDSKICKTVDKNSNKEKEKQNGSERGEYSTPSLSRPGPARLRIFVKVRIFVNGQRAGPVSNPDQQCSWGTAV
jgi:hypothetical protein